MIGRLEAAIFSLHGVGSDSSRDCRGRGRRGSMMFPGSDLKKGGPPRVQYFNLLFRRGGRVRLYLCVCDVLEDVGEVVGGVSRGFV